MKSQKLFRSGYIEELIGDLKRTGGDKYMSDSFEYDEDNVIPNIEIKIEEAELILPKAKYLYDYENSRIIFEAYKGLTPVQATDSRMWAYLSHITYWEYMRARRPIEEQPTNKRVDYILNHWFIQRPSAEAFLRHDISLLWWVAYLTYNEARKNPYELTQETFSMLDYTRHLLPGTQGRNRDFTHALLEYVLENKDLFKDYKETKVRFLMRRANQIAGYKVFPGLPKSEIKGLFDGYKKEIESTRDEKKDELS